MTEIGEYEVGDRDGMVTMTDEFYTIKLSPRHAMRLGTRLIMRAKELENPDE